MALYPRIWRLLGFLAMCQDWYFLDKNRNEGGRFVNKRMILGASLAVLFASTAALAQNNPSNLEKLGQFKTPGASPNIPMVPQGGAKAAALKKNWKGSSSRTASILGSMRSCPMRVTWRSVRRE